MKRILLFVMSNIAVIAVLTIVLSLTGADRFLTAQGLNVGMLLVFSLIVGFTGAVISLLMSKQMAKWSTGAQVIEQPSNSTEQWLLDTVRKLADRAGIGMPEVAWYEGEPNAFATGAFRNDALVAVSSGLLQNMTREEVEAVLGHEVAHIANGDMVTMTLLQGVVNTFVVFLSRVVGYFVDRAISRNNNEGPGIGYMITVIVCQIVFGLLAQMIVAWFSRHREFRADAGAAQLMGNRQPMINALARLGSMQESHLPQSVAAMGINKSGGVMELFSTHPPLEERINALRQG
ncbi:MAG: protease HtpX [Oxalobacteraceae bacterium]|nr:protease HtpX [Oxalobacteraceae bacterium]